MLSHLCSIPLCSYHVLVKMTFRENEMESYTGERRSLNVQLISLYDNFVAKIERPFDICHELLYMCSSGLALILLVRLGHSLYVDAVMSVY